MITPRFLLLTACSLAVGTLSAENPTPTPTPRSSVTPVVTPTPAVTPTPKPTPASATNTGRNAQDAQTGAAVPTDQSNKAEDLKATQEIRKRVMDDKELSLNAKNAKIITTETSVVLRGPVDSKADREKLNRYAREFAGIRTVVDQLAIETAKK